MKIGIDARLYKETGVGRYIRNLVRYLPDIDKENEYTLFLLREDINSVKISSKKWSKVEANVRWHTWEEQLKMPMILNKSNCDLYHFPYFNVPLLFGKKFIVTIHDLTILNMTTGRATTHSKAYYQVKRLGFQMALNKAIYASQKIITVSQTVKEEIVKIFKVPSEKIIVTYEAGDLDEDKNNHQSVILPVKNYLLYVGNAHPHKNIEGLIKAFSLIKNRIPDISLVLIGKDDFFYQRLQKEFSQKEKTGIYFLGPTTNTDLKQYYQNAKAFIFPSFSEGFGIPGLEAMSLGCPVIASDIPVFKEIYSNACLYFNPHNLEDIADKTCQLLNNADLRIELIEKGCQQAKKYSWQKMAGETLKIYEEK